MEYKTVGNLKIPQNLSPEKQAIVDEIAKNYAAKNREINKDNLKNMGRIALGSLISGASFHPILNIPYVGTGLGGAMYDAGQAMVEGDKLGDIAKRAGRGFAIGETVGAVPYVGKGINKFSGGKIGNALDFAAQKVAANPAVQKAYDALMSDVKAFNPNKQTAYHGSPYDFEKFSNEAIGTGEGAQAHGMGHYAALNKDVAQRYQKTLADGSPLYEEYKSLTHHRDLLNQLNERIPLDDTLKNALKDTETKIYEIEKNNLPNEYLEKRGGQLYKLSVPKDDVMLREDALMSNQPNMSNLWDEIRLDRVNKSTTSLPKFKMALGANDIDIDKTFNTKYFNDALEMVKNNPEQYKDLFLKDMTGKELYGYLESVLGSRKAATEYLQQRGIKGISYNGGIDGEARVIFNPDDIDIVRKYYNQPNLKDIYNKFLNSGAIAGAITNP